MNVNNLTFKKQAISLNLLLKESADASSFIKTLLEKRLPHLSYSSITSLEFCERRYFYEYIAVRRLDPVPEYLVKGNVFHTIAARYYSNTLNKRLIPKYLTKKIKSPDGLTHINNATSVMVENAWLDWEIVGVELPFVLEISPNLPPFIGIIDLLLKKSNTFVIVDHKTGKDFNNLDPFQLVFYNAYVEKTYKPLVCKAYFDQYRWVNNLQRVRKPAFQRKQIKFSQKIYHNSIKKACNAYIRMQEIKQLSDTVKNGDCWLCPYRSVC